MIFFNLVFIATVTVKRQLIEVNKHKLVCFPINKFNYLNKSGLKVKEHTLT